MKYLKYIAVAVGIAFIGTTTYALSTYLTIQGGTGTTTPSGILYGDNGATSHLNTVTIGSNLTFVGGTLSATGSSGSGSSKWATSTVTSTSIYPAGATKVGIGSTTPWGTLSVTNTSTDPSFVVEDATSPDGTPFYIGNSGDVGIGTAAPTSKVHVVDSGLTKLTVQSTANNADIVLDAATGFTPLLRFLRNSLGVFENGVATNGNYYINNKTANGDTDAALRINPAGNVLLGTSTTMSTTTITGIVNLNSAVSLFTYLPGVLDYPTFKNQTGNPTILGVEVPTGGKEATLALNNRNFAAGSNEFIDFYYDNYPTERKAGINIGKTGVGQIVPFSIAFWDQDCGLSDVCEKPAITINPSTSVGIGMSTSTLNAYGKIAFAVSSTTARSDFQNASTTILSANTFCLTADTCRTTWPSGGTGLTSYDAFTHPAVGQSATTSQLNVAGLLSTASSTFVGPLRIGPYNTFLPTGEQDIGYSPIQIYQDAFGSLIHQTGNPGYYFPRMLNGLYAPADNVSGNLGDMEAGYFVKLPVNGGCYTTTYTCTQGVELGDQIYTKTGSGATARYGSNGVYLNVFKEGSGTTTPLRMSFEDKSLGNFEKFTTTGFFVDPAGVMAIGNYASTSSFSTSRYATTTALSVLATSTMSKILSLENIPGTSIFSVSTTSVMTLSTTTAGCLGINNTGTIYSSGTGCGGGSGTVTSITGPTGITWSGTTAVTGTINSGYNLRKIPSYVVAAAGGDFTTIQGALTQCGTDGGGNIYLTDATYALGATAATFRGSNCNIYGRDATTTVTFTGTKAFATNSAVGVYSNNGIHNIVITGDGGTNDVAIDWSDMNHGLVENTVIDNVGVAIRLNDTQDTTFYNTFQHISATTITNIGIDASSTKPTNSNKFDDIFIGSSANNVIGFQLNNGNGNQINLLRVEPASLTGTVGIKLYDSTLSTNDGVFQNTFTDSYIEANATGISIANAVGAGGGVQRNVFNGGMIEANTNDFSFGSAVASKNTFINLTDSNFGNPVQSIRAPFGINTLTQRSIFNIFTPSFGSPAFQIYNNNNFAENATNYIEFGLTNAGDTSNLLELQNLGTGATIIATSTLGTDFIVKGGKTGIGTSTPLTKFQVTSGASATTTSTFGEIGQTSSHACFNTKNTVGAGISFYFVGTTMVVESNLCR